MTRFSVFFLFVLFCFTVSIPVPCTQSGGAVLEIQSVDVLSGCNPQTTCEHKCPCGKSVYFDLKETFATVSGATSAWLRTCPKKDELELWFTYEVQTATEKVAGSVKWGRKGRRITVSRQVGKLLSMFTVIRETFEKICQGGRKLTESDISGLRGILEHHLKKKIWTLRGIFVKHFTRKIKDAAREIFDKFVSKFRGKSFDYCSCEEFFRKGTSDQYSTYSTKATAECQKTCAANNAVGLEYLEFDENDQ